MVVVRLAAGLQGAGCDFQGQSPVYNANGSDFQVAAATAATCRLNAPSIVAGNGIGDFRGVAGFHSRR